MVWFSCTATSTSLPPARLPSLAGGHVLLRVPRKRRRRTPALHFGPEPPLPPPLPPGRVVAVPGRGEVFVREQPGPPHGPPVLLLHGWTASADLNWWRIYDHVPTVGSLLAIDHRGHGRGIRSDEPFTL